VSGKYRSERKKLKRAKNVEAGARRRSRRKTSMQAQDVESGARRGFRRKTWFQAQRSVSGAALDALQSLARTSSLTDEHYAQSN
jgi:hypothetical protein